MQNKNKINLFLIIALCLENLILIIVGFVFFGEKAITSNEIFADSKNKVVEIKAESDGVGVSYGTGTIIDNQCSIITNAHVITYSHLNENIVFDKIFIRFITESDFRETSVLKYDASDDLALLQLKNNDLNTDFFELGDSSRIQTGDKVYTLGNLNNYGLSFTSGFISMPSVNISYNSKTRNVIQCDLTISEGNSGGPLINDCGKLIGIVSFRLKDGNNNVIYGIAYCIPVDYLINFK